MVDLLQIEYVPNSPPAPPLSSLLHLYPLHVWTGLPLQVSIAQPPVSLPSGWTPDAQCSSVLLMAPPKVKKNRSPTFVPTPPPLESTAVISKKETKKFSETDETRAERR